MEDFLIYSPEQVIDLNLREAAERFDGICRQEHSHLCDLADELARTVPAEELLASLPDRIPDSLAESKNEESFFPLQGMHTLRALRLKVLLAMELRRALDKRTTLSPAFFFGTAAELAPESIGRVLYQKSSFADKAFLCFAEHLPELHSHYTQSFSQACEDVYNGLCEYCILPILSASEGHLGSFYRLIARYELKITATCTVKASGSSPETCFALLRRDLLPVTHASDGRERYLELTLPEGGSSSAADLLPAARLCGLSLMAISSLLPTDPVEPSALRYTFLLGQGDLEAFLLYLAMDAPYYRPIGLYFHLGATS